MARKFALVFVLLLAGSTTVLAQGVSGLSDLGRTSVNRGFFNFTEPGDISINVNVWGNVRFPGMYILKDGTDLAEVMSYCGSAQEATLLSSRRTRQTIVQLSRETASGGRQLIYERDLREMVDASDIPSVLDGDVVMVQVIERQRFYWQDLLPIASLGLATTNLILNVIRLRQD